MTSTREKLAAVLDRHGGPVSHERATLDALEAIVEEERNETIEKCARILLTAPVGTPDDNALLCGLADRCRALKDKAGGR